jgi:hypothetical protein
MVTTARSFRTTPGVRTRGRPVVSLACFLDMGDGNADVSL